ncbi:small GTPase superfamily [Flagelloscypha sp. PMI_526]|nr:small GTPase superfamily [Flagelloscypha sp. PMI_526]
MRQFNIVVLGAGGVGKSALTVRYVRNEWMSYYDPTIEEEYRRVVNLDGILDSLEILDTAGTEQFTTLNEQYIQSFQNGRGFILVFSLTQEASLKEVDKLRRQILQIKSNDKTIPVIVVGTKRDLESEREVSTQTIASLATKWDLPFYETSAKKNSNVQEVFDDMVRMMRKRYPNLVDPRKKGKHGSCIIS